MITEEQVLASLRDEGPADIIDLAARFGERATKLTDAVFRLQSKGKIVFDKTHALGRVWRLADAETK